MGGCLVGQRPAKLKHAFRHRLPYLASLVAPLTRWRKQCRHHVEVGRGEGGASDGLGSTCSQRERDET